MTTFYIHHESDSYRVEAIGLCIFILTKNNKPTLFSYCPEEVQEQIVTQLESNVIKGIDNPYNLT